VDPRKKELRLFSAKVFMLYSEIYLECNFMNVISASREQNGLSLTEHNVVKSMIKYHYDFSKENLRWEKKVIQSFCGYLFILCFTMTIFSAGVATWMRNSTASPISGLR